MFAAKERVKVVAEGARRVAMGKRPPRPPPHFVGLLLAVGILAGVIFSPFLFAQIPEGARHHLPHTADIYKQVFEPETAHGECLPYWQNHLFPADKEKPALQLPYLFTPGGDEPFDEFYARTRRGQCFKRRLLIVYMAADNNLSPMAYRDLLEMEFVGSTAHTDVVVFLDDEDDAAIWYYYMARNPIYEKEGIDFEKEMKKLVDKGETDETDPKTIEKEFFRKKGSALLVSPIAKTYDEGDSGNIKTAERFFVWAFSRFPAREHVIVAWGHGLGIKGGFAYDALSRSSMSMGEMAGGLRHLMKKYRGTKEFENGIPFEMILSDSCLNIHLENLFLFKGVSKYTVGSSNEEQTKGWDYRLLLSEFRYIDRLQDAFEDPKKIFLVEYPDWKPVDELARALPRLYGISVAPLERKQALLSKKAREKKPLVSQFRSYEDSFATMAVVKNWKVSLLHSSMNDLADSLREWAGKNGSRWDTLRRLMRSEDRFRYLNVSQDIWHFLDRILIWANARLDSEKGSRDSEEREQFWRIADYAEEVANDLDDENKTGAIGGSFLGRAYRPGIHTLAKGVGIWIPETEQDFSKYFCTFLESDFYRDRHEPKKPSSWARFIRYLHSGVKIEGLCDFSKLGMDPEDLKGW